MDRAPRRLASASWRGLLAQEPRAPRPMHRPLSPRGWTPRRRHRPRRYRIVWPTPGWHPRPASKQYLPERDSVSLLTSPTGPFPPRCIRRRVPCLSPVGSWSSSCNPWRSVGQLHPGWAQDRKSTRLNSSHGYISYAVFCLKKKNPPYILQLATSITSTNTAPARLINPPCAPRFPSSRVTHPHITSIHSHKYHPMRLRSHTR